MKNSEGGDAGRRSPEVLDEYRSTRSRAGVEWRTSEESDRNRSVTDVPDVSGVPEAVRMRRLSDSLMSNPPTTPKDIQTLSKPRTRVPVSPYQLHCRRSLSDDGRCSEMAGATYILLVSHPSPSSRPLGLWD